MTFSIFNSSDTFSSFQFSFRMKFRRQDFQRRSCKAGSQTLVQGAPAHLASVGAPKKDVERNGRHEVDDEPSFEVMHGDLPWMRDDFVIVVDVCGAEVDEDVDDESHIDWNKQSKMRHSRRK